MTRHELHRQLALAAAVAIAALLASCGAPGPRAPKTATEAVSRWVGMLQRGRISIYLLYSFLTLVTLLLLTQA